ncbi:Myb/SANT-like DNA-binding domain 4 [Dillenia turbinata]|uniref:Myb/SANT-like DNA-binding domain 4 n=1 Tax=Dillenia turbinata TaxID=194707 RepID=A0AAN8W204_9MAGN
MNTTAPPSQFSSSSPPPLPDPPNPKPLLSSTTLSPPKKLQPLPWTHLETINLIQAYQEKWYSLKRGQLKASQWEEVAVTVAARCGYDDPSASKSATQCRHKIEKLRKRYRSEKSRVFPSKWAYFDLMDRLERGPMPISAIKLRNSGVNIVRGVDDEDDDADGDEYFVDKSKSRSINLILKGPSGVNKTVNYGNLANGEENVGVGGGLRVSRRTIFPERPKFSPMFGAGDDDEEDDGNDDDQGNGVDEEEEEEDKGRGNSKEVILELASGIRAFAEGFMRMEKRKMELMKETERYRMEMENRRIEMILNSRRRIVDTVTKAIGSNKKLKMSQDI